jgi:hypothetical protein
MSPNEAFGVALILIACAVPVIVIGVVYYLKKRFEHKQIMIALEKGTPLSELRSVKPKPVGPIWIKYLSSGVLIFAIGLAFIVAGPRMGSPTMFVGIILCGVGIASLIRGLLYRKYLPKSQPSANSNASENRNTPDVSTPETLQPTNE